MNIDEFNAAAKKTRLKQSSIDAARMVLVDGLSKAEVGRLTGRNRSTVGEYVARIEREHLGIVGCPSGWRVVSACVRIGSSDFDQIKQIERDGLIAAGILVD